MKGPCGSHYCICFNPPCPACGETSPHVQGTTLRCVTLQLERVQKDLAYERQAYEALRNKVNRDKVALVSLIRDSF